MHLADPEQDEKEETTIVEGVLLPRSPLIGQSLRSLDFKERYGLQVLAIHRAGRLPRPSARRACAWATCCCCRARRENVKALEQGNLFNIFGSVETERLNRRRAPLAAAIFVAGHRRRDLQARALPVAMLGGAFLMLLTRCLSPEEAYRQVEWKALILIGALLSLGAAMEAERRRQVSGAAADRRRRRRQPLRAAHLLLRADRRA